MADTAYRIRAEERNLPATRLYAVQWLGPAGTKQVVRTPDWIEISYNGVPDPDDTRRRAAAMTADAFQLFHLAPLFSTADAPPSPAYGTKPKKVSAMNGA